MKTKSYSQNKKSKQLNSNCTEFNQVDSSSNIPKDNNVYVSFGNLITRLVEEPNTQEEKIINDIKQFNQKYKLKQVILISKEGKIKNIEIKNGVIDNEQP
jgi:hypothetical protein